MQSATTLPLPASAPRSSSTEIVKRAGLLVAVAALLAVLSMPTPQGLPPPQNMIAYGTDTFDARDFIRTGLVITLAAAVLLVIFALTYWPWMGYLTRSP